MILFKPYASIKNFLKRYTILKIGNFHVRLHWIVDKDQTTLYHNHPFNYISIILKGGYTEQYIKNGCSLIKTHSMLSIIVRNHNIYHRIENISGNTLTLFIAYGKYNWNAYNTEIDNSTNGVYQRNVNTKLLWSKRQNGIWFIGNIDKQVAESETRHSIHQV